MTATLTLDGLNAASREAFVAAIGDVFEHAEWVAEGACTARPFATVAALHEAMMGAVRAAPAEQRLAFLRGHPELGGKVARAARDQAEWVPVSRPDRALTNESGARSDAKPDSTFADRAPLAMTDDSKAEQGSLGLDRLSETEFARFERLNAAYREKFGFPFIICVRRHTRDSILRNFERRTHNDVNTERAAAIAEIGYITRLRLVAKVDGPGKPKTEGRISTHVLDTVAGKPAAGVKIALYEVGLSATGLIAETMTNADGRTDAPLVSGGPLRIGTYRLDFHVGDHFAARGAPDPPFLDIVPIRFSVAEPEGHYHVPLLVTPWSYATYRGS